MKEKPSKKGGNAVLDKLLGEEITKRLSEALKANPNVSKEQALLSVQQQILKDRPECPPENGKCPINDLPDELLVYIFQLGLAGQREDRGDDDQEEPEVLEGDDGNEEWEDVDEEEEEDDEEDEDYDDNTSDLDIAYGDPDVENEARLAQRIEKAYRDDDYPFHILSSHICQRWRSISINTHRFWTAIDIARRLCLDKTRTYIERSGALPLDIRIDCTKEDEVLAELEDVNDPDHVLLMQLVEGTGGEELRRRNKPYYWFLTMKDLDSVLNLLEPVVSRWGGIDFRSSDYKFVSRFLSRLHNLPAAPVLELFHISHHDDFDEYDLEVFPGEDKTAYLPFGGNAPKLLNAGFWGVHIDWEKAAPGFLSGLEHLQLAYLTNDVRPSYATFKQLIKDSPNLKELDLTAAGPTLAEGALYDSKEDWGPEPLVIPSLETFVLQFHSIAYGSALVQHLDLPNVTELVLDFELQDYSSLVTNLATPVRSRSNSIFQNLTSLSIRGLPCNAAAAEAMLSQLTSLKSLTLKAIAGDETMIFHKLGRPAAYREPTSLAVLCEPAPPESFKREDKLPKVFCPVLEELTTVYVDSDMLKELVEQRKALGAPLKRIRMGRNDECTYDNLHWLRQNVDVFRFHAPSDSEDEVESEPEWFTDEEGDDDDDDDDEDDEQLYNTD